VQVSAGNALPATGSTATLWPAGEKLDGAPRDAAASLRLEPTVQEGTSRGESGLPLFHAAMHNIAYWSVPAAVAV
jgi:hypothetical protein